MKLINHLRLMPKFRMRVALLSRPQYAGMVKLRSSLFYIYFIIIIILSLLFATTVTCHCDVSRTYPLVTSNYEKQQ
jgi:hypothetical protein